MNFGALTAVLSAFLALPLGAVCADACFSYDPVRDAGKECASYIAPTCSLMYRLWQPDGIVREFERTAKRPMRLKGDCGWVGDIDGDVIRVRSGSDSANGEVFMSFVNGRLRSYKQPARPRVNFADLPRNYGERSVLSLWPEGQEKTEVRASVFDGWRRSGRFRMGSANPNRTAAVLVQLALAFAALILLKRKAFRLTGLIGFAVMACLLFRTGSRGGLVALIAGGLCLALPVAARRLSSCKRTVMTLLALAVLAGGLLFLPGGERMRRRLFRPSDRGTTLRVDILRTFPRMLADAPGGWGFIGSGRAYRDWYQRLDDTWITYSLVGDHFTQLANFGWPMRFGYLFFWLAVLAVLVERTLRGKSPLPTALWLSFLTVTAFNRILESPVIWLIPSAAALGGILLTVRERVRPRRLALPLGLAFALATALVCVLAAGGETEFGTLRIRADGKRVLVKGKSPAWWVVDDGVTLGGGLAAKEMRLRYEDDPNLPAVGYVGAIADLPNDVHRLLLAGMSGWDFLQALNEGKFPADFNVPEEIVFLSPPFPPSTVPGLLCENARVRIVIGEFAAAYYREYEKELPWVKVLPGLELYVPDWMDLMRDVPAGASAR